MININKLKKLVQKDGKIEAQCPACQQAGADSTGNHLVVYPDGKFGCVANPGDKEHNKQILKLVGERGPLPPPQLQIRRQVIPESQVVMKIGRVGQKNPSPAGTRKKADPGQDTPVSDEVAETGPNCPGIETPPAQPDEITTEEARRFLDAA